MKIQKPQSIMLKRKLEGGIKPPLLIESKQVKCSGFMSTLPNIALEDEHLVFPIVFLATYPDNNNKGDKSSFLAHTISMVS